MQPPTPDPDLARLAATLDASYWRDRERWTLSYTEHTATAIRRRALAAQNGK